MEEKKEIHKNRMMGEVMAVVVVENTTNIERTKNATNAATAAFMNGDKFLSVFVGFLQKIAQCSAVFCSNINMLSSKTHFICVCIYILM